MSRTARLTDADFEQEVIKSEVPVLVEFWASWCPPCMMMEPLMAEMAAEHAGRVKVAALHVDQNQRTATEFGILGVPTFVLFSEGEEVSRRIGAQSRAQLERMLQGVE